MILLKMRKAEKSITKRGWSSKILQENKQINTERHKSKKGIHTRMIIISMVTSKQKMIFTNITPALIQNKQKITGKRPSSNNNSINKNGKGKRKSIKGARKNSHNSNKNRNKIMNNGEVDILKKKKSSIRITTWMEILMVQLIKNNNGPEVRLIRMIANILTLTPCLIELNFTVREYSQRNPRTMENILQKMIQILTAEIVDIMLGPIIIHLIN